jgi:magnesium chelatase family protein
VDVDRITGEEAAEGSAAVRARVEAARAVQRERLVAAGGATRNAELEGRRLLRVCALPPGGRQLLAAALRRRGLSARAIHRVLRVARTIADLERSEGVKLAHLAEAARYRIMSDGTDASVAPGLQPIGADRPTTDGVPGGPPTRPLGRLA